MKQPCSVCGTLVNPKNMSRHRKTKKCMIRVQQLSNIENQTSASYIKNIVFFVLFFSKTALTVLIKFLHVIGRLVGSKYTQLAVAPSFAAEFKMGLLERAIDNVCPVNRYALFIIHLGLRPRLKVDCFATLSR